MTRRELSDNAADYLTGPVAGEASRTEGGTTRDGAVETFGSSREDATGPTTDAAQTVQDNTQQAQTGDSNPAPEAK